MPQVCTDYDVGSLSLSPAQGFLLSRVDGRTSWGRLRECGAMPADEADRCLHAWVEAGVLVYEPKPESEAKREPGPASVRTDPVAASSGADAELDPSLDISIEFQSEVLAFERRLDQPYAEILGVAQDADARVLRRAYFKLSKDFHPDRYFRKKLGAFEARIERVFCKIAEAFEILSDPSARAEMEKSLAAAPKAAPAGPRLRGRTTPHAFSLVARIDRERRRKARQYYESGMAARGIEAWVEAAQQLALAIACDPGNAEYKEAFGEANRRSNELRAERYMKEADSRYELGEYAEAYKRYVDALHCRPFDAEANHRAAKLAWRLENDLKTAKEYAARACEVSPEDASYRKTLGHVYTAAELHLNAQREFETALRLVPGDEEARQELKMAKKRARRSPRGGA
ncbi:MAG: DnaJ domain-containing protein [Myxococcales bacterium]|nr:DnaJ domain-containing protein [Myxococcales bacterium]